MDGYSSDEDYGKEGDTNETKDFIDCRVALTSAAAEILDESEDYYKSFFTYLEKAT